MRNTGMVVVAMVAVCAVGAEAAMANEEALPDKKTECRWRLGDFTGKLYRQLAKDCGNFVFSPYGVGSVCALMATGANGETLDAFVKTLGLPTKDPDKIAQIFGSEKKRLGGVVELSDSIWLFRGFKPYGAFRSRAVDVFLAEARNTEGGAAAMCDINAYVNEKTHGKIPQLLFDPPSEYTVLAAVNTVYLNAIWACPFDEEKTRSEEFTTLSGRTVEVPFMHGNIAARIYDTEGFEVLSLPYSCGNLEMMFLLPDEGVKISRIEALLSESFLNDLMHSSGWSDCGVDVSLPKFEFEDRHDIAKALKVLGLDVAFDPSRADFSGMAPISPDKNIYLSEAMQVVKIKTNEKKTEAVAATYSEVAAEGAAFFRPWFNANRPFIFMLRDLKTGSIFFAGRVANPSRLWL